MSTKNFLEKLQYLEIFQKSQPKSQVWPFSYSEYLYAIHEKRMYYVDALKPGMLIIVPIHIVLQQDLAEKPWTRDESILVFNAHEKQKNSLTLQQADAIAEQIFDRHKSGQRVTVPIECVKVGEGQYIHVPHFEKIIKNQINSNANGSKNIYTLS